MKHWVNRNTNSYKSQTLWVVIVKCFFLLASKGVTPTGPLDFVPITKKSVTYIVAAVLLNEDNEVLMMQEAKPSCSGQWYLPAGRMEPGETICVSKYKISLFYTYGL